MLSVLRKGFDPYIAALFGTVVLASLLPARGDFAMAMGWLTDAAIVALFFLHGAKLSREAILAGIGHWRLHIAVLAATFVLFPLLGLAISAIPGLPLVVAAGMLFLALLPSTVQSSIAFTAIAGGNVAGAVCSASFSNFVGIFLTPLLVAALMGSSGAGPSVEAMERIVAQLLLPFIAGHLLRPVVGGLLTRYKSLVGRVDRGSILLVVYTAFSAAVVEGLWHKVPAGQVGLMIVLSAVLLAAVMAATWYAGRAWFAREDAIVLFFCGSKKSLASGVPMAGVLFPAAQVGAIILPLMIFHQIQLVVCAIVARRLAEERNSG